MNKREVSKIGGLLGEYLKYGLKIGLFTEKTLDTVYGRLAGSSIEFDSTIPNASESKLENGVGVIRINPHLCDFNNKRLLTELAFQGFSHLSNEIFRDLNVYGSNRVLNFKKQFESYNSDCKYPEWGMILLDESISGYTAKLLTDAKYGKTNDDEKSYELAKKFAKTIYKTNDPFFKMCQASFDDTFWDSMIFKYGQRFNGYSELYSILGYMGNIGYKTYRIKYEAKYPVSVEHSNKNLALVSKEKVFEKINKVLETGD